MIKYTYIIAVDLNTRKRYNCKSIKEVASKLKMKETTITYAMRKNKPIHDFMFYKKDEVDEKKLLYYFAKYAREAKKVKTSSDERVSMRIDSKTIIFVRKEHANETYAEWYKRKNLNGEDIGCFFDFQNKKIS